MILTSGRVRVPVSRLVAATVTCALTVGVSVPGVAQAAGSADWAFPAEASVAAVARSIGADTAYAQGITGKGIGIALIDTGVVPVQGLTSGNIVNGPDLSLESQIPSLLHKDGYGHGTHLAGIIAGRDSITGTGFRGVAPDATLTSIKVGMANGAVDVSQVIAAIDWVVAHRDDNRASPIRVLNLSYGTDSAQPFWFSPLAYAVENAQRAGISVVVAAGNTGSKITVPATDIHPVVVGSVDMNGTTDPSDDTVSSFSASQGRIAASVDVLAPGRSVASLRNPGSYADVSHPAARVGERFFKGSGTSQSAAVVSGAVALFLQKYPKATAAQVRNALWGTPMGAIPGATPARLNIAKMLSVGIPTFTTTPPGYGAGTGSLNADRGSSVITFGDNTILTGERDIFGPFNTAAWATASRNGTSWNGGSWMGHTWTGTTWDTATDNQANWAGAAWSGRAWSGRAWSEVAWSGRAWSGRAWSGTAFSGAGWSGVGWSGATWK